MSELLEPRRSGAERALLARGLNDSFIVIATDGVWLTSDIHDFGIGDGACDLGLEPDRKQITENCMSLFWLWEGHFFVTPLGSAWDPKAGIKGTARPVTMEELPSLLAMEPPKIICHSCSRLLGAEFLHASPSCHDDPAIDERDGLGKDGVV